MRIAGFLRMQNSGDGNSVLNADPGTSRCPGRPASLHVSTANRSVVLYSCRLVRSTLRTGLGNADITGHFVLSYGINDHLQRASIGALMEEDRLVDGQILSLDARVVHYQGNVVALLGDVSAAQFHHEASDLLWLVLGVDG